MSVTPQSPSSSSEDGRRRVILTALDRSFTIHLWEDRTRGEQWVPAYDARKLTLLSDEFLRIASNNAVDNGQRSFEFKAIGPGTYDLVFEKRMGWKFTAEDRRVFQIQVADKPSGS